jgi:hypothetical protein
MHMRDLVGVGHHFLPSEPTKWNVEDVYEFIRSLPGKLLGKSFPDGLTEREWGTSPPSRRSRTQGATVRARRLLHVKACVLAQHTLRTELKRALAGRETA